MAVEETLSEESMDAFVEVVHKLADAARVITLKYFRSKFQIIDKADLSERTSLCTLFLSLRGLCSKLSSNPRIWVLRRPCDNRWPKRGAGDAGVAGWALPIAFHVRSSLAICQFPFILRQLPMDRIFL
jgi:hypothetical protein